MNSRIEQRICGSIEDYLCIKNSRKFGADSFFENIYEGKNLSVEYDEGYWHQDLDRDIKKTEKLLKNNCYVIRIRNNHNKRYRCPEFPPMNNVKIIEINNETEDEMVDLACRDIQQFRTFDYDGVTPSARQRTNDFFDHDGLMILMRGMFPRNADRIVSKSKTSLFNVVEFFDKYAEFRPVALEAVGSIFGNSNDVVRHLTRENFTMTQIAKIIKSSRVLANSIEHIDMSIGQVKDFSDDHIKTFVKHPPLFNLSKDRFETYRTYFTDLGFRDKQLAGRPEVFGYSKATMDDKIKMLDEMKVRKFLKQDITLLGCDKERMRANIEWLQNIGVEPNKLIRSSRETMEGVLKLIPMSIAQERPTILNMSIPLANKYVNYMIRYKRTFRDFSPGYFAKSEPEFKRLCQLEPRTRARYL